MTNIYLVRHAHTIFTPEELTRPLSEQGLRDVEKVTDALLHENIEVVLSSQYLRAKQTVMGIADALGLSILEDARFRERKIAEQPVADHKAAMDKLWSDYGYAFEGGESNLEAQKRGVEAILEILEKYKGQNVVVGTHGNIMVLMMNYFDKQFGYEFWKQLQMPDIYKLSFAEKELTACRRVEIFK